MKLISLTGSTPRVGEAPRLVPTNPIACGEIGNGRTVGHQGTIVTKLLLSPGCSDPCYHHC